MKGAASGFKWICFAARVVFEETPHYINSSLRDRGTWLHNCTIVTIFLRLRNSKKKRKKTDGPGTLWSSKSHLEWSVDALLRWLPETAAFWPLCLRASRPLQEMRGQRLINLQQVSTARQAGMNLARPALAPTPHRDYRAMKPVLRLKPANQTQPVSSLCQQFLHHYDFMQSHILTENRGVCVTG